MSEDAASSEQPLTRADLAAHLEEGCKPAEAWRIGTEHEKFGFNRQTLQPLPYEGEAGVRAMLDGLAARFDWTRVEENGRVIALKKGGASITLEPGGQFELSGAPLRTIHETCDEVHRHLAEVESVAEPLGVGFLGMGFAPNWARADMHVMPKARYDIMRAYMPTKGALGLDMMLRTATVQVNLDYSSEADMVKKFRVALALQPIATALFANSPFTEGKPNGYLSYRSHIWTDTDPDRTGMLGFVFEDGFGFERYVDYVLAAPMYFVRRDGRYVNTAGESFAAFLEGRLPQRPGERPSMEDWDDHLSTVFPEVRLKTFLEMRGADGGPWARLCALPAFWVGLLYNDAALDAAWDLVKDWTAEEREALRDEAPRLGLKTPFRKCALQDLAREALAISRDGLAARAMAGSIDRDETDYLNTLDEIAESGETLADAMLRRYAGEWGGDAAKIFEAYAY
ncbi:MAG: glutamate--cysteine ligase [Pseudomonadota bacterium]